MYHIMYIILVNMPVYANIVPELNWCYQRWNFTLHGAATYCHVYHIVTNRLIKKTDATNISGMSCRVELKKKYAVVILDVILKLSM